MPSITGTLPISLSVRDAHRSALWCADLLGMERFREFAHPDGPVGEVVLRQLNVHGVAHSGAKELPYTRGVMITFRNPDSIQLEFSWPKP